MKRREAARHERRTGIQAQSTAGDAAVRAGDLYRVRVLEPAETDRACKVHRLVAIPLPFDWRRYRLGDVSVLALKEGHLRGRIDSNFLRMLLSFERAEVAQWESSRFVIGRSRVQLSPSAPAFPDLISLNYFSFPFSVPVVLLKRPARTPSALF